MAHPRLAIVTGADSGIGKATAELLATEGFDVGLTFHTDESGAEETRAGLGHSDPALDLTYERWREVLATDLDGPFLCARRATPRPARSRRR